MSKVSEAGRWHSSLPFIVRDAWESECSMELVFDEAALQADLDRLERALRLANEFLATVLAAETLRSLHEAAQSHWSREFAGQGTPSIELASRSAELTRKIEEHDQKAQRVLAELRAAVPFEDAWATVAALREAVGLCELKRSCSLARQGRCQGALLLVRACCTPEDSSGAAEAVAQLAQTLEWAASEFKEAIDQRDRPNQSPLDRAYLRNIQNRAAAMRDLLRAWPGTSVERDSDHATALLNALEGLEHASRDLRNSTGNLARKIEDLVTGQ